jgi:signal recognition particle subunit SEC65
MIRTTITGRLDKRYKMSESEMQKAISMRNNGCTLRQIAEELGCSITTVDNIVNPEKREQRKRLSLEYQKSKRRPISTKDKEYRKNYMREWRENKKNK